MFENSQLIKNGSSTEKQKKHAAFWGEADPLASIKNYSNSIVMSRSV